ncbi:MAG: 2OG-Fe(II) oxygenase [Rhodospirillaceae bacterium]|nr:2OG-Fe(II) oxygenase [Rhodospirillaceae bacterium]
MNDVIDLRRYPLDRLGSADWQRLVDGCRARLRRNGLVNLPEFVRRDALHGAVDTLISLLDRDAYVHAREHNIYFRDRIEGLPDTHPALTRFRTSNRKLCADQMAGTSMIRLYEWPLLARFLAAVMDLPRLWTMDDPLARVNVMSYGDGEALSWHFDRSEFTITLLLQAPEAGGAFEYARDLRSDDDPNYDGVARLLEGRGPKAVMALEPGTLNIFRGRNTAHRVTAVRGPVPRMIAVFSYYARPGVTFTSEERRGFYGRVV